MNWLRIKRYPAGPRRTNLAGAAGAARRNPPRLIHLLEGLEGRILFSYGFDYNAETQVAIATGNTATDALTVAVFGGLLEHSVNGSAFSSNWNGATVAASDAVTLDIGLGTGDGSSLTLGTPSAPASLILGPILDNLPSNNHDTVLIDDSGNTTVASTYAVDLQVSFTITAPGIQYSEPESIAEGGVTLEGGSLADTYDVESAYFTEGVTLVAGDSNKNVINVGDNPDAASSTLNHIYSQVSVGDPGGFATLNVLDAGDTDSTVGNISGSTITGLGFNMGGSISYAGGFFGGITPLVVNGGVSGNVGAAGIIYNVTGTTAPTTINTSVNADVVNISGTGSGQPLIIHGVNGQDAVNIGSGSLAGITGTVDVDNDNGLTQISIDDSGDTTSHNAMLTAGTLDQLSGVAPASIFYTASETSALDLTMGNAGAGSNNLTIDFSAGQPLPSPNSGGSPVVSPDTPSLVYNAGGGPNNTLALTGDLPGTAGPGFDFEEQTADDPDVTGAGQHGSITFGDHTENPSIKMTYAGVSTVDDTANADEYAFGVASTDPSFTVESPNIVSTPTLLEFISTPHAGPAQFATTNVANKSEVFAGATADTSYTAIVNVDEASAGLTALALFGNADGDTFNFLATPAGIPVSIRAEGGHNVYNLGTASETGGLDNLAGPISIDGSGSGDDLTLNDELSGTAETYAVTDATVTSGGPGGSGISGGSGFGGLTYNFLGPGGGLTFNTSASGATVNVTATDPDISTGFFADSAATTFNLGDPSASAGLDDLAGPVSISGQGSGVTVVLNDQDDTNAATYTVNSPTLTRTISGGGGGDTSGAFGGLTFTAMGTAGSITLNTTSTSGGATDAVNVLNTGTLPNLNLHLDSPGQVNLGSSGAHGTLVAVHADVDIVATAQYTLELHDENDTTARAWILDNDDAADTASIAIASLGTTTYRPSDLVLPLSVNGGSGGNAFAVDNTTAHTETDLDTGSGADTVHILRTGGNNMLVIDGQNGADAVTLGGELGTGMQSLGGDILVTNTLGQTALTLDDSQDTAPVSASLTDDGTASSPGSLSPAAISYTDAALSSLTINAGSGANTFTVSNTSAHYPITLNSGTAPAPAGDTVHVLGTGGNTLTINGQNGADTVTLGGAAVGMHNLAGTISVTNASGQTALTLDDSQDTVARTIVLSDSANTGTATGLSPAVIHYADAGLSALTILAGSGGNTITVNNTGTHEPTTLDTGTNAGGGGDTVSVLGTGTNTLAINGQAGADTVTLGGVALPVGMQHLAGTITISNSSGQTALTLDDSEDATGRTAAVTDNATTGTVTGLAPASIGYTDNDISALTILGGSGNNDFTVNGTFTNSFLPNALTTLNPGVNSTNTVTVNATNSASTLSLPGAGAGAGAGSVDTLDFNAGANTPSVTAGAAAGDVLLAVAGAGTVSAQQFAAVNITNAQAVITPGPAQTLNAIIDSPLTNATVATFTLPARLQALVGTVPASEFTASIDWGDGSSPTPGSVTIQGGSSPARYVLQGSHTYTTPGSFSVTDTLRIAGATIPLTVSGVPVSVDLAPSGGGGGGGGTSGPGATSDITLSPASLAFTTQPAPTVLPGATLAAPIVVAIKDVNGNTVASDNATITLTIATGPAGAVFTSTSTTSVAAVNGVATFNNLALTTSGLYTLSAADSADSLSGFTSAPGGFAVTTNTVLNPGQKFVYTDSHNAKVTVSFAGKSGTATIIRAQPANQSGDALAINLANTTTTSGLAITVAGGTNGGVTTVGQITDNAPINTIAAPGINLTGAGVTLSGSGLVNTLTLRDLAAGAAITEAGTNPAGVSLTLGAVGAGATINLASGAKAFTALDWSGAGTLAAPWLGTLKISGSTTRALGGGLGANLTLSGTGAPKGVALGSATITGQITGGTWSITGASGAISANATGASWSADITGAVTSITTKAAAGGAVAAASITTFKVGANMSANVTLSADVAKKPSLGTLTVTGTLTNARIVSAGGVQTITLGAISNSSIDVGVSNAFLTGLGGLPTLAGDFADPFAAITSLSVKGIGAAPSFVNSIIAAGILGTLKLGLVDTGDSGGHLFGIGGTSITSLACTIGNTKVSLTKVTLESDPRLSAFPNGDFDVAIA